MRRLPSLTALRAFEAAARHLSFKAAGDELNLTPTAISHQIKLLEEFCGHELFRRRPRPLTLTNAGTRLFPVIRNGLDSFATVLADIKGRERIRALKVTTTNAFATLWLVPRLPSWRSKHPEHALEIIGTDAVVDLKAGEADVAIRYMLTPPRDFDSDELVRDRYWPVCSPKLLKAARKPIRRPADLAPYTLIDMFDPDIEPDAPTWPRWLEMARRLDGRVAATGDNRSLKFREELHAIEAILAGQGVGLCSDALVSGQLRSGALIKVSDLALPGRAFYVVRSAQHPRRALIDSFAEWLGSVR
jgi:LysR family glycine cleavage system transcriptional activator